MLDLRRVRALPYLLQDGVKLTATCCTAGATLGVSALILIPMTLTPSSAPVASPPTCPSTSSCVATLALMALAS